MRAWSVLRRHAGDVLVVALAITATVEPWFADFGESRIAASILALLWTLPLLARRQLPLAAPLFATAALAAESFIAPRAASDSIVSFATGVAIAYMIGFWNDERRAVAGALAMFATAFLVIHNRGDATTGDYAVPFLLAILPTGAGQLQRRYEQRARALQERTRRLALEREQRTHAAVGEERARIARELHDVIAHSISVMTIQAGAARMLLDGDPLRAEGPLVSIEDTGRETLAELRRLLGVLRRDMAGEAIEPRPTLANLESLLAQVRESGLPVSLEVSGEPRPLAPGLDLAAYRIVQEALTNARKHAGPAAATVAIHYLRDRVELAIDNAAGSHGAARPSGAGHGIVGMRERVAVFGGTLEAGPRPDGGFHVLARLPTNDGAA